MGSHIMGANRRCTSGGIGACCHAFCRWGSTQRHCWSLSLTKFAVSYDCSPQDFAFARMQYANAIQALSGNLSDQERSYDPGNTAAILFLHWYEVRRIFSFRETELVTDSVLCEQVAVGKLGDTGWAAHNKGLARLVQHIGPYRHQHWLARKYCNHHH